MSGPLASHSKEHSTWFDAKQKLVGPRIGPVIENASDGGDETASLAVDGSDAEAGRQIQYRTCSWQKTAALLFSEYICLAIMSFPWSYSILGLVPGLILTVITAGLVLYTSLVLWEFCLRHPEVRDICDIGQLLFWNQKWAWYATAFMFLMNNTFIQALHILVGVKYINTVTSSPDGMSCPNVSFGVVVMIISWLCSLPRTFKGLSHAGTASAVFTFFSVALAAIFAGIQTHPAGYDPQVDPAPIVTAFPVPGTKFVAGMNAFLNIAYTFIGQITLPSFIAEMEEPRDFPKALWACTIAEVILFSVVGSVVYAYTGNQYMTAPAFGSLKNPYKDIAFSFMIPTIIFLGVLYASVSARFIFFRLFHDSRHKREHTVGGWAAWSGILFVTWLLAFVIAHTIPFFSSLLSLMSSLFDSFFGFIFWGVAYFRMRKADGRLAFVHDHSFKGYTLGVLNAVIILIGLFFLTFGSWASVEGIVDEFRTGTVGKVFACKSAGL